MSYQVKCTNCGMEYGACLDNNHFVISCPRCKNEAYNIIDPDYQGPWKKDGCINPPWLNNYETPNTQTKIQ